MRSILMALILVSALSARAQTNEEVPFVPTPDHVALTMLRLADVGPRDHVLDLGSGDGRIVIAAAKRFRARATGVEIVTELVQRSRAAAERAGVSARVRFIEQDLFKADLAQASVITMYLLPEVNLQLRPKLLELAPGTRIVSHDWDLGDWLPDRTVTVPSPDKKVGREKLSRVHLWIVPARLAGLWCGTKNTRLRVEQSHQMLRARWEAGDETWQLNGRVDGRKAELLGVDARALHVELLPRADRLHLWGQASGLPHDARLERAQGDACPG